MRRRKFGICLVATLLSSWLVTSAAAQEVETVESGSDAQASGGFDFAPAPADYSRTDSYREGAWMWGMSADQLLLGGSTSVSGDAGDKETIYVGGVGNIVVSNNSGGSWYEGYSFASVGRKTSDDDEDEDGADTERYIRPGNVEDMRANRLREYLRTEIENQLGSSDLADSLLDDITDDELLDAKDINDLDTIASLNLDIESDLTQIPLVSMEQGGGVLLSDYDTFISRYIMMRGSGAEEEQAVSAAADSPAVWSIESTTVATYAVTSDSIYLTIDKGQNWMQFMQAPEGEAILSFDISSDGRVVLIGTTSGIVMTRDGGGEWLTIDSGIEGAVYSIHYVESDRSIWALTTSRLYRSLDQGLTWDEVETRLSQNEVILEVIPGIGGRSLMLTTETLYQGEQNGSRYVFSELPHKPFAEETIEQIYTNDPSLSHFLVRTQYHVFEYVNGWVGQNKSLFTNDLGAVALLNDGVSMAIMATSSGVWFAQDSSALENSAEYQALQKKWAKEPSDADVIMKSFEAHYIGDWLDSNWSLRSGLAWLLPTVTFEYFHEQYRQDIRKTVEDEMSRVVTSDTWTSRRLTTQYWELKANWTFQVDTIMRNDLSASFQIQQLKRERQRLQQQVQKELNKRHALELTLALDFPKFPEKTAKQASRVSKKKLKVILSLEEVESNLNYLTGGYYLPALYGSSDSSNKYANY